MSFSSDVKSELCKVKTPACCRLAECLGLLLFGRAFSKNQVVFQTENLHIAERLILQLKSCFQISATLALSGVQRDSYTVGVYAAEDCQKLRKTFGFSGLEKPCIPVEMLQKDCCVSAFIRGAFLACGSITDPQCEYHAEFCLHKEQPIDDFAVLLGKIGLTPGVVMRNGAVVLYFKGSNQIEDLLTTIRATRFMLELAEIKVYKDLRNHYNRLTNCEAANISKTVGAAVRQREAILALQNAGVLETLSAELQAAATLRLSYPEAALKELCAFSTAPITKSGLNHRLNRLVTLAEQLQH